MKIERIAIGGAMVASAVVWIAGLKGGNASADSIPKGLAPPYPNTFFDSDPNNPWNRLYGTLFIRPAWDGKLYGLDEMDPLYWRDTHYLLDGPMHQKVLGVLDDFIQADSARLVTDPLERALFQRILWALFDSLATHKEGADHKDFAAERREIEVRLVKIMKSVALTDDEIKALPDNYRLEVAAKTYPAAFDPAQPEQPFLPGTFFSGAEWVDLMNGPDGPAGPIAPVHVRGVSGRSAFHVLMSLPTGRSDTLDYLKKLNHFEPHWLYSPSLMANPSMPRSVLTHLNAELPQVPVLTKFALVRMANLIDARGDAVNSPLMESVQLRVIGALSSTEKRGSEEYLDFFILDQMKLMRGQGGLVARKKTQRFEMVLSRLMMISGDTLERHWNAEDTSPGEDAPLTSCLQCHGGPGIFSMNSYRQLFQDQTVTPPDLEVGDKAGADSVTWKEQQYDWGLLQAYWFQ